MKSTSSNSTKQGDRRFAMIPATVLCSDAYRALTKAQLRVYSALALHANKERACHPSVDTLAAIAGVDTRTVEKATNKMIELGLVAKQSGGGRRRSNRYQLIDQAGSTLVPATKDDNPGQLAGVSVGHIPGDQAGVCRVNPGEMVAKPRPPRRGNIQEQTYMNGDDGSSHVDAIRRALSEAGITGPNLDRLADLDDITVDDVEALSAIAKDRATQNPTGLLVKMIDGGQRSATSQQTYADERPRATKPSRPEDVQAIFADYAAHAGT